ncbi:MAG: PAS domain-containing protein [Roseiflexaceae bacterium]|nr:PAS domain-containing protein [Roseiflexaceae bacterium]
MASFQRQHTTSHELGGAQDGHSFDLADLETLFATAPIGAGMVDLDLRFVWSNERLAQMCGLPVEQQLGRSALDLFPQYAQIWIALWKQVLQTGQPIVDLVLSSGFDSPGDQEQYLLVSHYPVRQQGSAIQGIGLLMQDITERKRAELGRNLLARLGERMIKLNSPQAIVEFTTRAVSDHFRITRCVYGEVDLETRLCTLMGGFSRDHPIPGGVYPIELFGVFQEYLHPGEVVAVEDAATDPRTTAQADLYQRTETAAVLCASRVHAQRHIAVLVVTSPVPRQWIAHEIALLRSTTDVLWLALERTRLYQQSQANERRYRTLVHATSQAIWSTDSSGRGQLGTEWWSNTTGQTNIEAQGWGWLSALHPDDRARARRVWEHALDAGNELGVSYRIRDYAGVYHEYEVRGIPLRDRHGAVEEWMGTFSDITIQRRAGIAARFLDDASALFATMPDTDAAMAELARLATREFADLCVAYLTTDQEQPRLVALEHADPAYHQTVAALWQQGQIAALGCDLEEAQFFMETDAGQLAQLARSNPQIAPLEWLDVHSLICVPLRARDRQIGELHFALTISGRRFYTGDFAAAKELARRAALAIDNAQLYHEAHNALQARDHFLSIAAHELRTPLTVLLGQAQLALRRAQRQGTLDQRDQHGLEVVIDQARHLNILIGDMLDVSRLESGQLRIAREPVDIVALATQSIAETHATAAAHTLRLEAPSEPLLLQGDALRLGQVLQNLLSNAVKYSPNGGEVLVTVESHNQSVQISVRDQGIGIPTDMLPHLFQRFSRTPNTGGAPIEGIGIGLYVVREIVRLHGGTITVASTEGIGSTFTIDLPSPKQEF